ncbi:hypothetical protein [Bradyrhizobium sp. Ash2021]|uniref:hypothetical protein n=1 Tax=Bradyrhizobium sp. Ash2021 TaxID=2954771 RepID=UPI0028149C1E|nr:hypothetical protein [Bradyrhizobium sp. Ash2021]WMT78817.1 hypothetical protein NL528_21825 [Bradyrhizobium sp. Ash2021]
MRAITILALTAFLSLTIAASFTPAYAAAGGAMSGKGDFATRGYNQAAKEKKVKGAKTVKPKPQ